MFFHMKIESNAKKQTKTIQRRRIHDLEDELQFGLAQIGTQPLLFENGEATKIIKFWRARDVRHTLPWLPFARWTNVEKFGRNEKSVQFSREINSVFNTIRATIFLSFGAYCIAREKLEPFAKRHILNSLFQLGKLLIVFNVLFCHPLGHR